MPERPVQLKSLREYTDLLNYVEAYRAVYVDTDNTPNNTTVRGRALLTLTGEDRAKFLALRGRGSVAFHEFLLAHPDLFNLGGLRDMHSMVVMGRNAINLGGGSMPSQDAIDEARADYMVAAEEAMLATNEVLAEKAQVLKDAKSNLGKSKAKRFGKTLGAIVTFALIAGLTGFLGVGLYSVLATSLATTLGIASGASVIGVIAGIVGGSFLIKSCIKRFKAIGKAWNDNTAQVNTDKAAVAEAKREHEKALQKARVNESRYNEDLAYENSGAYGRSVTRRERTMGDGYESVYTPVAGLDDLPMPELGEIFDTAYRGRTFASEDEAVAYVRAEFGRHAEDLFDAFTEASEESKNAKLDEWAHAYVASHPPVIAAEDTHSDDEEEEVAFDIDTFAMPADLAAELAATIVGPYDTKDSAISAVKDGIMRATTEIRKPDGTEWTEDEVTRLTERWAQEYVDAHWEALRTPEEEERVDFDTMPIPEMGLVFDSTYRSRIFASEDEAIAYVRAEFSRHSDILFDGFTEVSEDRKNAKLDEWAHAYVASHPPIIVAEDTYSDDEEEEVAFDIDTFEMPADLKSSLDAFVGKYKTPEEARIAISRFIHEFNSTGEEIKKPDGSEFTVGDFRKIVNRWTDSYISESWESLKEEEEEINTEDTHAEGEEYAETEEFLRRINHKFSEMLSTADETIDSKEKLKDFVDSILSSPEFGFENLVEHLRKEGKATTEKERRQVYDKLVESLTERAWERRVKKDAKGSEIGAEPVGVESGYESTEPKMNSETRAKIATELGDAKFDNVADAAERVKAIVRGIDDETLFSHVTGLKDEEKEGLRVKWAFDFIKSNKESLKTIKSLDLDKIKMPEHVANEIDTYFKNNRTKFVDKLGTKLTVEGIIESLNVNFDYIGGPILSDAQKERIIIRWANDYVESRWEHIKASEVKLENEDHKKAPETDLVNVDKLPLPGALKNLLDSSVKKDLKKFTDRTGAEAYVATSIKSLFKPEFVDGANLTDEQVEKLINRWAKDYVSSLKDLFVEEEEEKSPELTKEEKIDLLKKGLIELENDDCDDKELVAAAMVARPEVLARATDEIRKDKEFISERIKENSGNAATIIENCHQEIKTDDSFAKKIVNAQPTALSSFEAETQISVVTKLVDTKPELIAGLSDEAIDILVDLDNGGDIKFKTIYDANPEIIEHLPREVYIDKNESMGKFIDNIHDYPTYTPAIFDKAIERFEKVITTGNIVDAIRENKRIEEMIINNYETARPEDIKRVAQANIQLLNTQDTKENIERVRALIDGYKVQINDLLAEGKFTEAWNVYKQAKYIRENELGSQGLKEIPDKEIRELKTQVEEARDRAFQESPEAQQLFKNYEISITEAIKTGNIQLSDSLLTTYKQEVYSLSEDEQGEYLGKIEKFEKDFNKLVEESKNVSNDASTKTESNIASVYDFSDMDRIIFEIREELKVGNIDKAIELYNGASEHLSKLESGVNGSGVLEGDMADYLKNNTMEEVVDLRRRLEGVADKIQDAIDASEESNDDSKGKEVPVDAKNTKDEVVLDTNKQKDDISVEETQNVDLVELENQQKIIQYLIDNQKYDEANTEIYVYEEMIDSLPEEAKEPYISKRDSFINALNHNNDDNDEAEVEKGDSNIPQEEDKEPKTEEETDKSKEVPTTEVPKTGEDKVIDNPPKTPNTRKPAKPSKELEELEIMLYNKMGEEMYKLTGHDAKESYESGEDFDVAVYIDSLDMEIKTLMEELNGLEDEEEKAGVQEELQMVMETRDSLVRLSSISDLLLQKITKEKFNSAGERLKLHGKVPKDVSLTSDLTLEELEANYVATLESEISKVVPKGMSVDQALATMDKRKAETKILSNNNIMLTAMKTDFSYLGREQSVDKGVEEEVKKIEAEIKEIQEKIKALNEQEKSEERDSEIYNLQVKINVLNNQKQELLNQQHLGPTSNKA